MTLLNMMLRLMLLPACWGLTGAHAAAADIEGVWASDARLCSKMFVKRGKSIVLAKDADQYGSGFVIDGSKIRESSPVAASRRPRRMARWCICSPHAQPTSCSRTSS